MDTTLIIIVLGVALFAIVALPALFRKKSDESSLAPPFESTSTNASPPRPATPKTLDDLQSQWLVRWLCEQARAQTGVDVTRDPLALTRIGEAAKKAQAEVDASGHAEISLPYIAADASGPKHLNLKVTHEQLASVRQRVAR